MYLFLKNKKSLRGIGLELNANKYELISENEKDEIIDEDTNTHIRAFTK